MKRLLALTAGLFIAGGTVAHAQLQIPDTFTNLQVLSKDISKEDLTQTMRGMAIGLGVRCNHCHVRLEGGDNNFDFAADDMEHKIAARIMIAMTREINARIKTLPDYESEDNGPAVQCITCHQRQEEPPTIEPRQRQRQGQGRGQGRGEGRRGQQE